MKTILELKDTIITMNEGSRPFHGIELQIESDGATMGLSLSYWEFRLLLNALKGYNSDRE